MDSTFVLSIRNIINIFIMENKSRKNEIFSNQIERPKEDFEKH